MSALTCCGTHVGLAPSHPHPFSSLPPSLHTHTHTQTHTHTHTQLLHFCSHTAVWPLCLLDQQHRTLHKRRLEGTTTHPGSGAGCPRTFLARTRARLLNLHNGRRGCAHQDSDLGVAWAAAPKRRFGVGAQRGSRPMGHGHTSVPGRRGQAPGRDLWGLFGRACPHAPRPTRYWVRRRARTARWLKIAHRGVARTPARTVYGVSRSAARQPAA